jgi:hypothetical protein
MTPEATLARLREYMVGSTWFMSLLSCFELGIIDTLREPLGMTAAELGDAVGAKPDAVEQLLHLLIKEDFVAYDEGFRCATATRPARSRPKPSRRSRHASRCGTASSRSSTVLVE